MAPGISTRRRRLLVVATATSIAALVGAGALASQRGADRPVEAMPAPPPPETLAQTTRDLDLPVSTSIARDHTPDAVSVLVTRGQLLVGGDPNPIAVFPQGPAALAATGLPARLKRNGASDYEIPELSNGLSYFFEQGLGPLTLAVLADARTPYRVLSEVLFTADVLGLENVHLAVRRRDASLGWLDLELRGVRVLESSRGPGPDLFVTGEGLSIRWRRGKSAPGCDPRAAGTLVPMAGGGYDLRALTDCLRRIQTEAPEVRGETLLALHVMPSVDLQTLVSVVDATLGTTEAGPLFPVTCLVVGPWGAAPPAADEREDRRPARPPPRPSEDQGPLGTASIGGAALSGGAVANASAVVAGMAAGFRRCYNRGLQEDSKLRGSARLTAKIGPNGEVLAVSPSSSGLSEIVVSCLAARVMSAQFAPPEGGGATLVIPATFVPQ